MQTICAHCFTPLNRYRQRNACILCSQCEQHWAAGKLPDQGRELPAWAGGSRAPFSLKLRPTS